MILQNIFVLTVVIFIYYFKGFLSISDIQELLQPITDRFFGKEDGLTLSDIYEEVFQMEGKEIQTQDQCWKKQ